MNILQVYPYYPPAWSRGGVLRVVHGIARRLVDRGHDVTVFTTDIPGSPGRNKESESINIDGIDVRCFSNLSNWSTRRLNFPIPIGFGQALRSSVTEYDVIHVHGFPHLMAVGVARVANRNEVPYIVTPHGSINQPNEDRPPLYRRLFYHAFAKTILAGASAVTALTDDEKRRLESIEIPIDTLVRIPNGIDVEGLVEGDGETFRKQHGFTSKQLVGFIGRLHKKKGLDVVIECADRLRDESNISFVIIGPDDGYETELRRQIRDRDLNNTSLLGYVSEAEKRSALEAINIFLHPSYGEGQPMAVLEACATATAVVISNRCALPEISRAEAGIVTAPDADATASALKQLLTDVARRREMGQNGRHLVESTFRWERVLDQYESVYENMANRTTGDRNRTIVL